jgi:endoglucanase
MENVYYVPAGLDTRPLDAIMGEVRALGFNAIRLPFSNRLVEQNPIVRDHLRANPDLVGLHALQVLDRIVADAGKHGIRIILDNGRSEAGTPPEENGLWYSAGYPERVWIRDWVTLARRYAGNPTVVGADLRNEPHTGGPGPWTVKAYLRQGATWGPYAGVDNPATDWRLAAERAGDAILKVNPHMLIIVEGLQLYPDPTRPGGVDTYWWGGILQPAATYPVQLTVPNRLVYSPHEYGPYKVHMSFFNRGMSYKSLSAVWDKHWGYLDHPATGPAVPIFIGEFGTCGRPSCVADSTPGSTGKWFGFFTTYLKTHPEIGWAYWALNGTNQRGANCPNYILTSDWARARLPALLRALEGIGLRPTRASS